LVKAPHYHQVGTCQIHLLLKCKMAAASKIEIPGNVGICRFYEDICKHYLEKNCMQSI